MKEQNSEDIQKDENNDSKSSFNKKEYQWFFKNYEEEKRKIIFSKIYGSLFIDENQNDIDIDTDDLFQLKNLSEFIKTEDNKYNKKTNEEIIQLFYKKKNELNLELKEYEIQLLLENDSLLCLEDLEQNYCLEILCLRNVRFGEKFEWICNPDYLLYYQYFILNFKKPSRVKEVSENNEKVETIDSYIKAEKTLEDIYFIYIKDSVKKNFVLNKIINEANNEKFFELKENIFKYLNYNTNDPKQIEGSDLLKKSNYYNIISFCYSDNFNKLVYSFNNGYYFFEINLIKWLEFCYHKKKRKYLYLNLNKIKNINTNKYLLKDYLGFWMAKLFSQIKKNTNINDDKRNTNINNDDKRNTNINNNDKRNTNINNVENEQTSVINSIINIVFKNKSNYLGKLLEKLNENFQNKGDNILIILNNVDKFYLNLVENLNILNVNVLLIINIQNNFELFESFYYEGNKYKLYFLEYENEISFKSITEKGKKTNFYSVFETKEEYEKLKKITVNQIFDQFPDKDKLLFIAVLLNSTTFINQSNIERNEINSFKVNLGYSSHFSFLKFFFQIINLEVSVNGNNTVLTIDDIKFKESIFHDYIKELYLSKMMNYLNQNSNELSLNDIKGPLLEKDIILNILTGQIKDGKYSEFLNFQEIRIDSIFCLNFDKNKNYNNNKNNNVVITQNNKTAEFYDVAFKINRNGKNYMKMCQISILKDILDLGKIIKESIALDIINFDLNHQELNIGEIEDYSFSIITSITVYNQYKLLTDKDKKRHTYFLMLEHCNKNGFEFFIYNYFTNEIFIPKGENEIQKIDNFFENTKKIDLLKNNTELYRFINSSKKKYSCKAAKNLLSPIENYFQADNDNEVHIINLGKYEFDKSMLNLYIPIENIGLAFWNDSKTDKKQFDNILINYNKQSKYFIGDKISINKLNIFSDPGNRIVIHALIFLVEKTKKKIDRNKKEFLKRKRKNNELYLGKLADIKGENEKIEENIKKRKK